MAYRKRFEVGDRVRILKGHRGAGTELTLTKVVNYITHYVEGNDDKGSFWNVPLHWVELVRKKGE